jgi:hypothetical protein
MLYAANRDAIKEGRRYMTRPLSNGATAREIAEVLGVSAEETYPGGFWQTTLGRVVLAAMRDLFAQEITEIERAQKERERALKADEAAQRELFVVRNRLAACEAALGNLPNEMFQGMRESDEEAATNNLRKERERLLSDQGRLRERLIEAKAQAAKAATNERQETDRFARRVRQAHSRAKAKRNKVHDLLEQSSKEVDDRLGEAWLVALAFGDEQARGQNRT